MTTSLYVAILAAMFIFLSAKVVKSRRVNKTAFLDGGNEQLQRCIRAHGNFVEYTPFFLIMLAMAEYQGLMTFFVHFFGLIFVASRLSHAYSILVIEPRDRKYKFRIAGMISTFSCLGVLALILLYDYLAVLFY